MAKSHKEEVFEIKYPGFGNFKIIGGSDILRFRAETFLTKEPTTLEWLQSLEPNSILIDIGANIGIYSVPASLFHVKKVIAIEPEIKNYNKLLENLSANKIASDKCEAIPVAISTQFKNQYTKLYLTEDIVGASCHQIGINQDFKLRPQSRERKYRNVYCISLSKLVEQVIDEHDGPVNIKIDVDGIEADVCQSLFDDGLISKISSLQIELNPSIKQHLNLIQLLQCVGFNYDPAQVEKACRKGGAFEGYAEYVFRRSLSEEIIAALPRDIAYRLGSQALFSPEQIDPKANGYFSSTVSRKALRTSRMPATFIVKDFFDYIKCSKLFNAASIKTLADKEPFEFKIGQESSQQHQKLRHQINVDTIKNLSPSYLDELHALISNLHLTQFVTAITSMSASALYTYKHLANSGVENELVNRKIVCRVRHFVDICGYSLSKHHDSVDTLCAVIVPILPYSTATSIVSSAPFDRSCLANIQPEKFIDDAFRPGNYYDASSTDPPTLAYFYKNASKTSGNESFDWTTSETPYTFNAINLYPGEALFLPNPLSKLFINNASPNWNAVNRLMKNCGHGVLPSVCDIYRPVLLIDYMILAEDSVESCIESSDLVVDLGAASLMRNSILKASNPGI